MGDIQIRKITEEKLLIINKYAIREGVHLLKIELIKEHNIGVRKYQSLSACNRGYYNAPEYNGVLDEEMETYKVSA